MPLLEYLSTLYAKLEEGNPVTLSILSHIIITIIIIIITSSSSSISINISFCY